MQRGATPWIACGRLRALSTPSSPSSATRRFGVTLAVATVLLATVATQWPFHYDLSHFNLTQRWAHVDWSWVHRSRSGAIRYDRDFALNLLMLIPLGIGFGLARRAGLLRVAVEALVLGTLVSVAFETAQLATHYRFTALPDVWRNALGCVLAAVVTHAIAWRRGSASRS